jgi:hypothetical protein
MIDRRLFGISAACMVLAAASAPAPALDAEEEAVEAAYRAWNEAFNKGDAKALAAQYTENGLVLPPTHEVVRGRAAIERFRAARVPLEFVSEITCNVLPTSP